jgi:hypothetical protein
MGQKIVISQTPANTQGSPNPLFYEDAYDILVQQKGYDVIHESAIKCPCQSKDGGGALANCQNCGGTGWVFINAYLTRMVLQSINLSTKYKQWSAENFGTVTVTSRKVDVLTYMDRITVKDSESIHQQILRPQIDSFTGKLFAWMVYTPISIMDLFKFSSVSSKLIRLVESVDFVREDNKIIMNDSYLGQDLSLSVRYKHYLQYHVLENTKETRNTRGVDTQGQDKVNIQPFTAIARRSHYVLDQEVFLGTKILNNSYNTSTVVDKGLDFDKLDSNFKLE